MIEMNLSCECCGHIANEETVRSFKRIYVVPMTELPTEHNPEPTNRVEKCDHLDVCGACYERLDKLFDKESEMQKGQVK